MTNNPLIDKWEEIYGNKEEPKPEPIEPKPEPIVSSNLCSEISLPKSPQKRYLDYDDYDYLKVALKAYKDIWYKKIPTGITSINRSWDDTFREISLKITNKNARVSKLDRKLTNGLKKTTYTIEVEVYD